LIRSARCARNSAQGDGTEFTAQTIRRPAQERKARFMSHSFSDFAYTLFLVSDMPAAREFYCGKLGLTVALSCYDGAWLELNVGTGTLVLTTRHKELGGTPGSNGAVVSLEVNDLSATIALLEKHGIKWTVGPVDAKYCRGGIIEDADGNRIMFHESKVKKVRPTGDRPPADNGAGSAR